MSWIWIVLLWMIIGNNGCCCQNNEPEPMPMPQNQGCGCGCGCQNGNQNGNQNGGLNNRGSNNAMMQPRPFNGFGDGDNRSNTCGCSEESE